MNLESDEKLCPFCFEAIKKQALVCRYCRSRLGEDGPVAGSFSTVGAEQGITIGGSGHHIEGGIQIALGQLESMDEESKKELLSLYQSRVLRAPVGTHVQFALGLCYLDMNSYELSLNAFKAALAKSPRHSEFHYYIALASIGGRQPRSLPLAAIKQIESSLITAIELDGGCLCYRVLLAIVKYDYYGGNGLLVPRPGVAELLASAGDDGPVREALAGIIHHVVLPPGTIDRLFPRLR
jgi:tetratricopeptide (TPR) repeat protein